MITTLPSVETQRTDNHECSHIVFADHLLHERECIHRVYAVYALYTLYSTQPFVPKYRIHLPQEVWRFFVDLHQEFASAPHPHPLQVLTKMRTEQHLCWTLFVPPLTPECVQGIQLMGLNLRPRDLTPWPVSTAAAHTPAASAALPSNQRGVSVSSSSSSSSSSSAAAGARGDRAARYEQFVAALDPLRTNLHRFIRGTWKQSVGRQAKVDDPERLAAFHSHPAEVIPTHQLVRAEQCCGRLGLMVAVHDLVECVFSAKLIQRSLGTDVYVRVYAYVVRCGMRVCVHCSGQRTGPCPCVSRRGGLHCRHGRRCARADVLIHTITPLFSLIQRTSCACTHQSANWQRYPTWACTAESCERSGSDVSQTRLCTTLAMCMLTSPRCWSQPCSCMLSFRPCICRCSR